MPPLNIHGTLIVIDDKGVLLRGPSGSGKSSLALSMVSALREQGTFAAIVADDRILLTSASGRLLGACPPSIADYIEVYGAGIASHISVKACSVDLCCDMQEPDMIERLPADATADYAGIKIPLVFLPLKRPVEARNVLMTVLTGKILAGV